MTNLTNPVSKCMHNLETNTYTRTHTCTPALKKQLNFLKTYFFFLMPRLHLNFFGHETNRRGNKAKRKGGQGFVREIRVCVCERESVDGEGGESELGQITLTFARCNLLDG